MSISIEAIKFNFDPAGATYDAFNLRRNATAFVTVPEWRRGVSERLADSVAAYAIEETVDRRLQIEVLLAADPAVGGAEVRALADGGQLGDVAPKAVVFTSGSSGYVRFDLVNTSFHQGGVRCFEFSWKWQYRRAPSESWTNFGVTAHRIFITLRVPRAPWQQTPYGPSNTQLPWSEVLEAACDWATGEKSLDNAAGAVTQEIYNLGPATLEYDCPGGGGSRYSHPDFFCTEFLELLSGGLGRGRFVNCSDCATFVSTFANALGCEWWQSRMGNNFDLRRMLAIGSSSWQTACGWASFSYHEVAWSGACDEQEVVCDACLQVSTVPNPPYVPLLPVNMKFGNAGAGEYRDKLATSGPNGSPRCRPQPTTRKRRVII